MLPSDISKVLHCSIAKKYRLTSFFSISKISKGGLQLALTVPRSCFSGFGMHYYQVVYVFVQS